jgi:hypothetical protein
VNLACRTLSVSGDIQGKEEGEKEKYGPDATTLYSVNFFFLSLFNVRGRPPQGACLEQL